MEETRGRTIRLTPPRRFILDLLHFARKVPSVPVARVMGLGEVARARAEHPARPSWSVLFLKAYALVAREHGELRRSLVSFPYLRLYEHPFSIGAMALEREHEGEPGIFVGLFRRPETQSIEELMAGLREYQTIELEKMGFFRQAIRVSRLPTPIRRFLWWSTLEVSGFKRAKRFGTFGLSTYGALGAESLHPISPLTATLTYGPIDRDGVVTVKIIYDHRVLDGAQVARRLADLERALKGPVMEELRAGAKAEGRSVGQAVLGT